MLNPYCFSFYGTFYCHYIENVHRVHNSYNSIEHFRTQKSRKNIRNGARDKVSQSDKENKVEFDNTEFNNVHHRSYRIREYQISKQKGAKNNKNRPKSRWKENFDILRKTENLGKIWKFEKIKKIKKIEKIQKILENSKKLRTIKFWENIKNSKKKNWVRPTQVYIFFSFLSWNLKKSWGNF